MSRCLRGRSRVVRCGSTDLDPRRGLHQTGLRFPDPALPLETALSTLPLRALLWLGRRPLTDALGPAAARRAREDAVAALPALVAHIPDLGPRPGARAFLVATAMLVAFHRAVPSQDAATNAALFGQCLRAAARWLPTPVRRVYRWIFFQPWFHRRLVAQIVGGGPDGFVGQLEPSAPGRFGVTYERCALQLYLARLGQTDLGPHVCGLDDVESEIFELGLARTGTLGRGAPRCDFRWTHPGAARDTQG